MIRQKTKICASSGLKKAVNILSERVHSIKKNRLCYAMVCCRLKRGLLYIQQTRPDVLAGLLFQRNRARQIMYKLEKQ